MLHCFAAGGMCVLRWIRDKSPSPLQVTLVRQRPLLPLPCSVPGTRTSQDPCLGMPSCHARKTGPAASPHAAAGMREGTAPRRGLLAFFKVVWGRAEPQVCSRAVVCNCPCHSLLLSCGWDTTHDFSSCDDRISRVFPLQDVAVSGGDSAYAFVAMYRRCPAVCLLLQDTH